MSVRATLRRALRDVLVFSVALIILGSGVGHLLAGMPGFWGGLIGGVVAAGVSGATVGVMLLTAHLPVGTSAALGMAAWVVKAMILLIAFLALQGTDLVNRPVFGVVIVIGVIGSLVVDIRAVLRGRVPYTDPSERG
jgi:hypothetical protein